MAVFSHFESDVGLVIAGFSGSTKIASLAQAFGTLNVSVTLPGSNTSLISTGQLEGAYLL